MTMTRKDDAATIVGEELAEVLDAEAKKLVGKSETEGEAALVVKGEGEGVEDEPAGAEVEKHYAEVVVYQPYGGATSLQEAEEFIQATRVEDQIWSNWDVFSCVAGNIMACAEPDFDKLAAMRAAVDDFGSRVATIKSSAVDAYLTRSISGGEPMKQKQKDEKTVPAQATVEPGISNDPVMVLQAALDAALADRSAGRDATLQAVQGAIDGFVGVVKSQIDAIHPPPPGEEIAKVVQAMLQPIAERLDLLTAKMELQPAQVPTVPVQKSVVAAPGNAPAGLQTPLTVNQIVRRSVGLPQ